MVLLVPFEVGKHLGCDGVELLLLPVLFVEKTYALAVQLKGEKRVRLPGYLQPVRRWP